MSHEKNSLQHDSKKPKLVPAQLVEFSNFYGNRRFVTVGTRARHRSLPEPDKSSPYDHILFLDDLFQYLSMYTPKAMVTNRKLNMVLYIFRAFATYKQLYYHLTAPIFDLQKYSMFRPNIFQFTQ